MEGCLFFPQLVDASFLKRNAKEQNKMIRKVLSKLLNFNSSRKYLDDYAKQAALSVPAGALVLDAGAGTGPYKRHFSHTTYESADFCDLDNVTYICDLTSIPVEDRRYDLVFCSQVLEHLPEPKDALKEIHRVLKPDGTLWLSAPLFYEEHEAPYDFYRYTQYGFKYLLESAGFTIRKIEWLEGYYGTLSYQLNIAASSLPWHPKHYGGGILGVMSAVVVLILKPLFAMSAILFSRLDLRKKLTSIGQCKNYAIVAIKGIKES